MTAKLSRRKITNYIADSLATKNNVHQTITRLAGLLIDTHRTKELDVIVRDIEYALAQRGIVSAQAVTAFDISAETRQAIEAIINARRNTHIIQLQHFVNPDVIGGVKLDIPGYRLDTTIAHKLSTLRTNYKK